MVRAHTGTAVLAAAGALLLLGVAGAVPAVPGAVAAALLTHALFLTRLVRYGRARRPQRQVCCLVAGLGLVALGTLGAGLAERIAPVARLAGVPLPAEVALISLFFCVGGYLVGVQGADGGAAVMQRVRQCLDGATIGICLFFVLWGLLFDPAGVRGAGLTAGLLASIAVAAVLVSGFREGGARPGAARAAAGAALSIGGLTGLTLALDYFAYRGWTLLAGAALATAPVLLWDGVRRFDRPVPAGTARTAYPLVGLPLVAAGVVAAYHLVQRRSFDPVSLELGVAGMGVVAAREWAVAARARRYAAAVAGQDAHLRSLVAGSRDVTMVLDSGFLVRWQSSAAARQFGLSDQDVLGRPVLTLLDPRDVDQVAASLTELAAPPGAGQVGLVDARMRDGFGAWRDTEWSVTQGSSGTHGGSLVVHIRDVSRHRELERALRRGAATDALTGLANRHGLRSAVQRGQYRALILVGLGVAAVNNVRGHDVGDAALVEAARRLRGEIAYTDTAARLDAATFAVLTEAGAVQAHLLATRLLTVLTEPYPVPGAVAHLPASAGLSDLTDGGDLDEALRRAELALHSTRGRKGGRAVEWYDESTQAQLRQRLDIEQELPGAIGRGELDLAYQPVVELASGRPVGAEALLRWRHPRLGPVPPAEFIPVAEDLGLLDEITQWVLHWTCRQLSIWDRDGRDIWVSVNVGAGTLATPAFVAAVSTSLEAHLVPAARLVIEVAEPGITAAAELPALVEHLGQLQELGVRTAVDHFGTGSTSLSQLRVLPLDLIKIDRQIFGEPAARTGATAIVDVVVKLGRHIGLEVIAQALESESDVAVAGAAGCRYGQGYVLSRPAPPEHLEAYLDEHRVPRG